MPTGYTSNALTVTSASAFYKKTNTTLKTGIRVVEPEVKWFKDYPKEDIIVSGSEMRVPLMLTRGGNVAAIPDGGNEAIMSSPVPTNGVFYMTQLNKRYGYTGLAAALNERSKASMIENQTQQQTVAAISAFGRTIAWTTYGQSTGTMAVVKTTGASSATQVIPLKNAYGSATFVPGGDVGVQDAYLSSILPMGEHIALIRAGAVVEFGTITASPSASAGIGYIDATFTSAITPTANDLIVFANADGDNTISGTDINNWPIGFTEALTANSVMGVSGTTYPAWAPGSASSTTQRLGYAVKAQLIDNIANAGGMKPNRYIIGQGVRRDAIAGLQGGRRYDGASVDLEGDLKPGEGEKYLTSAYALPNTIIGFNDRAFTKVELSDMPDEGMSKSMFRIDKVQGKSQIAAYYDYFFARIPASRASMGYVTNLTSQ